MKTTIALLSLFCLISCKKNTDENKPASTSFQLGYFDYLPEEIDGCSETATTSADTSKIVYASDLQNAAFIKDNEKVIQLEKDTVNSKAGDKKYLSIFKNKDYKIILDTKETKEVDEVFYFEGSMKVFRNDSLKAEVLIKGEGGC
jgi:hypothetical protein